MRNSCPSKSVLIAWAKSCIAFVICWLFNKIWKGIPSISIFSSICLFGLLIQVNTIAAQSYESSNAHTIARANINSLNGSSSLSFASPALIIDTKRRLSLFANNQYTLKDLTSIGAFTRWRSNANQWSGGTSVFGNNNYKEYRFNVGYALKIENNFYFGVAANAWHFSFREKEANLWLLSINPALNYQYKKIEIGVNLKNIGLRKNAGNFLQESISIGFGYRLPNIQLLTEVEKFVNRPLLLKCALDYTVSDNLSLQYGFAFGNFNQYAGIRYLIKTIWLEFAIYHQSNLGSSSGFAIEYSD